MYKWELVGLLWLAYFFNQADRAIYNVVLPQLKAELGLSDVQAGLVASIFLWTYACLVPVAGYLGDVVRRKSIIFFSLLFWSAATIISGFSSGLLMLIIFRSLATGGGEAFYYPSANSLLCRYHTKTRALAMSIHQTSLYAGIISSSLISGWIAEHFGWRAAFFVFGSFGVFLAALIQWRVKKDEPESKILNQESDKPAPAISIKDALRSILRTPSVWCIWIAFATANFAFLGYLTWTPTFLVEKYHQSLTNAGFSSMFYHHIFAFLGVLLGGKLSDRFALFRRGSCLEVQILGLLLCAPFVLLLALPENVAWCYAGLARFGFQLSYDPSFELVWCYAGLAGFGFFRGFYESNLFASLFDVVKPQYRATAVGLMLSVGFIFSAFSPVAMGWAMPRYGISQTFAMLAPVLLVSVLPLLLSCFIWLKRDYVAEVC